MLDKLTPSLTDTLTVVCAQATFCLTLTKFPICQWATQLWSISLVLPPSTCGHAVTCLQSRVVPYFIELWTSQRNRLRSVMQDKVFSPHPHTHTFIINQYSWVFRASFESIWPFGHLAICTRFKCDFNCLRLNFSRLCSQSKRVKILKILLSALKVSAQLPLASLLQYIKNWAILSAVSPLL